MNRKNPEEIKLPNVDLEKYRLKAGPRKKTLATEHLEYILYALLDEEGGGPSKVRYVSPIGLKVRSDIEDESKVTLESPLCIMVSGKIFNISSILKAAPDFTHLVLNNQQLNVACQYFGRLGYEVTRVGSEPEIRQMHLAEKIAIYLWTSRLYGEYNMMLSSFATVHRESYFNDSLLLLTAICIASHGLQKPLEDEKYSAPLSFRMSYGSKISEERRKQHADEEKPLMLHGFTSANMKEFDRLFGDKRTVISQSAGLNPQGKNISVLSIRKKGWNENEVLFPPNTEFIYVRSPERSYHWLAMPVRSLNIPPSEYKHSFSSSDLLDIQIDKFRIQTRLLLSDCKKSLNIKIQELSPGFLGRLFSNKDEEKKLNKKIKPLKDAVNEINKVFDASVNKSSDFFLQQIESLLVMLNDQKQKQINENLESKSPDKVFVAVQKALLETIALISELKDKAISLHKLLLGEDFKTRLRNKIEELPKKSNSPDLEALQRLEKLCDTDSFPYYRSINEVENEFRERISDECRLFLKHLSNQVLDDKRHAPTLNR